MIKFIFPFQISPSFLRFLLIFPSVSLIPFLISLCCNQPETLKKEQVVAFVAIFEIQQKTKSFVFWFEDTDFYWRPALK